MAKHPPGKDVGGRPPKTLGLRELEMICRLNCTDEEVAAFFQVHVHTIQTRKREDPEFLAAMERGKSNGRLSVRRAQMRLLEAGNATMGVWLGKQLLGQRDNVEVFEHRPAAVSYGWVAPVIQTQTAEPEHTPEQKEERPVQVQ